MNQGTRTLQPPLILGKEDRVPSSSPAFDAPLHPIPHTRSEIPTRPTILPVVIPPASLRPLAFRTLTKKHQLTLTSTALQALAAFIGRTCGSGWREDGLAEKTLEEFARAWKKSKGKSIVEGESEELQDILSILEDAAQGVKPPSKRKAQQRSDDLRQRHITKPTDGDRNVPQLRQGDSGISLSTMKLDEDEDDSQDVRKWLRVVNAFDQPRFYYNMKQKQLERCTDRPTTLPSPERRTLAFRYRYNLVHQRLLRNESFQTPTILHHTSRSSAANQISHTITSIANLLGRSGTSHVLLGLLTTSPTGCLMLSDLTGSVVLNLSHARAVPEDGSWFCPGMILIVEGVYEDEGSIDVLKLGGGSGVGGTIGGKFVVAFVGGPPCERREVSYGIGASLHDDGIGTDGGFGWIDFLGVGSYKALGSKMQVIKERMTESSVERPGRSRVVCLGELALDNPNTLQALRKVLGLYAAESAHDAPVAFVLSGNFISHAVMGGGRENGSIEYKESFDLLASALSEYPTVLQAAKFIFVPGDNDPWASLYGEGAAVVIPRKHIPELFTNRIQKTMAAANNEVNKRTDSAELDGEAIWTSNPMRISLFGPLEEVVIFRDDLSGRLRRNACYFNESTTNKGTGESLSQQSAASRETNLEHGEPEDMEMDDVRVEGDVPTQTAVQMDGSGVEAQAARKLVKTILDQGCLSPFALSNRPIHWDRIGSIQLYPLPSALILIDTEAPPFTMTYEGCVVMNPGKLAGDGRKNIARWVEYDSTTKKARLCDIDY